MKTKRGKCPNCCPDGGAILTVALDAELKPVWRCNNCFTETPRQHRRKADESSPLTPSQLKAITKIQLNQLRDGHEVKQFRLVQLGSCVSVVVEVGRKGDEGTLASVLCRTRGHFFVSRLGKIQAVDPSDKVKAKKYPLIYGWRH